MSMFGRYEFQIEMRPGTALSHQSSRSDNGAGKIDELVDFKVGPQRIRAVDGALTLDGKDCGRLEAGDKVRFTADGKLYVNDSERGQ